MESVRGVGEVVVTSYEVAGVVGGDVPVVSGVEELKRKRKVGRRRESEEGWAK